MALDTSLPGLLATLTQALTSATESVPEKKAALPPKDGISLLDVKNELLLSYLQNLVFLVLLKLRNYNSDESDDEDAQKLDNQVVQKLVEMRVYLEKGVRPLEARLKYQIDKVLRAADDAARAAMPAIKPKTTKISRDSDSEAESEEEEEEEAGGVELKASEIDDLQYRPNPTAFMKPVNAEREEENPRDRGDGVYKPPRITATAMPTTERREKNERKPQKSATLDEFISTELSETPFAQPSIGSQIVDGGRRSRSERRRIICVCRRRVRRIGRRMGRRRMLGMEERSGVDWERELIELRGSRREALVHRRLRWRRAERERPKMDHAQVVGQTWERDSKRESRLLMEDAETEENTASRLWTIIFNSLQNIPTYMLHNLRLLLQTLHYYYYHHHTLINLFLPSVSAFTLSRF